MSAGIDHQWMVLWTARLMERDGFVVSGFHGPVPQGGARNRLPLPVSIYGHRPDIYATRGSQKAIGEAKTPQDINSPHSLAQYGSYRVALERGYFVYLVCPQSSAMTMDRAMMTAGLTCHPRLVRMHLPDAMLESRP